MSERCTARTGRDAVARAAVELERGNEGPALALLAEWLRRQSLLVRHHADQAVAALLELEQIAAGDQPPVDPSGPACAGGGANEAVAPSRRLADAADRLGSADRRFRSAIHRFRL